MLNGLRFPFIERTNSAGQISVMPYVPITLSYRDRSLKGTSIYCSHPKIISLECRVYGEPRSGGAPLRPLCLN